MYLFNLNSPGIQIGIYTRVKFVHFLFPFVSCLKFGLVAKCNEWLLQLAYVIIYCKNFAEMFANISSFTYMCLRFCRIVRNFTAHKIFIRYLLLRDTRYVRFMSCVLDIFYPYRHASHILFSYLYLRYVAFRKLWVTKLHWPKICQYFYRHRWWWGVNVKLRNKIRSQGPTKWCSVKSQRKPDASPGLVR